MKPQTLLNAIYLLLIGLCLVACSSAVVETVAPTNTAPPPTDTSLPPTETPPPVTDTPSPVERGRVIFENGGANESYRSEIICAHCHSLDGSEGDEIFHGPSMLGISERAGDRVPELSAEEYIRQSILQPKSFIVEGYSNRMSKAPALLLSEEEVEDLVAFLLTQ